MQMIMPYRRYRRPASLGFPFGSMMPKQAERFDTSSIMKTDIRQTEDGLELAVELPGFSKDDVEIELKDGYVIVSAQMQTESEESSKAEPQAAATDETESPEVSAESEEKTECKCGCKDEAEKSETPKNTWVRRERFFGSCQRSFYIGEDIDEEHVSAKFENGLLNVSIPKMAQPSEPEQKKLVSIED